MFCVNKDDYRWQPMCSNPLSNSVRDRLLGDEECKSPFGTYELQIPVDKTLSCKSTAITDTNCKDLDVSILHEQEQLIPPDYIALWRSILLSCPREVWEGVTSRFTVIFRLDVHELLTVLCSFLF